LAVSPHYRWYIVGLTLVNQAFTIGILIYSFALFVVPWLDDFAVTRSEIMMAIFSLQVLHGLLAPVLGRMMDQYEMRWLVVTGGLLIGTGLGLLSQATSFWQVIVIYSTFLPLGMILCGTLASQTMVSKWFVDQRGIAIGISSMGTSIGGFLFPLICSYLIASFYWHGALLWLGGAALLVLIPLNFILLRQQPPSPQVAAGEGVSLDSKVWTTREILSSKNFWIPVIGVFPLNAAFGGIQFNLGAYMSDLGMTQAFAAQLIATTSILMVIGKFVFGSLGDRVDHRYLYWTMAGLMIVSLVLFSNDPSSTELMFAAAFMGSAMGGVMPMMGIMYASRFGTYSFGRVLGLVNLFLMIGSFGSIFSGWVFDMTASYDVAFWCFGALLLPCVVIFYFLPPVEQQASRVS
jgi:MFS family permease